MSNQSFHYVHIQYLTEELVLQYDYLYILPENNPTDRIITNFLMKLHQHTFFWHVGRWQLELTYPSYRESFVVIVVVVVRISSCVYY